MEKKWQTATLFWNSWRRLVSYLWMDVYAYSFTSTRCELILCSPTAEAKTMRCNSLPMTSPFLPFYYSFVSMCIGRPLPRTTACVLCRPIYNTRKRYANDREIQLDGGPFFKTENIVLEFKQQRQQHHHHHAPAVATTQTVRSPALRCNQVAMQIFCL